MTVDAKRFVRAYMHGLSGRPPVLRDVQRDLVRTMSETTACLVLGARQIGKTTAIGYLSTCLVMGIDPLTGEPMPADNVQIASSSQTLSRDILRKVRKLVDHYAVDVHGTKRDVVDRRRSGNASISTTAGNQIQCHSGDPRSLQGFAGHTICDELGATRYDPEEVYSSSLSGTSGRESRIWVGIGNASKAGTWWHQMFESAAAVYATRRRGLAIRRYTIHDAYPEGLPPHLQSMRDRLGGAESAAWRRWFLCEFLDGYDGALTEDEILGCQFADPDTARGDVVIGVDPGGWPNPTGVCVTKHGASGGARVLHAEYWRTDPILGDDGKREAWTQQQVSRVVDLAKRYRATSVVVDHATVAGHVGPALQRALGARMVTLVATSTPSRQKRWGYVLDLIRQRLLYVPETAGDLLHDMRHAEVDRGARERGGAKISEGGTLVLPQIPDDGHILHCDVLDALLLSAEPRL